MDVAALAIPGVPATYGSQYYDDALGAARWAGDPGEAGQVIEIYGFRGTGRTAEEFMGPEPLIYAGHVGISLDEGKTIYGFTPHAPDLSGAEVIEALKNHVDFPGQVLDDTAIFHRAQDLAEQGYRTQVYVQSIRFSEADFKRIRNQVMDEISNSPMAFKRYEFPDPVARWNCATWPLSVGIPIPEPSGKMPNVP